MPLTEEQKKKLAEEQRLAAEREALKKKHEYDSIVDEENALARREEEPEEILEEELEEEEALKAQTVEQTLVKPSKKKEENKEQDNDLKNLIDDFKNDFGAENYNEETGVMKFHPDDIIPFFEKQAAQNRTFVFSEIDQANHYVSAGTGKLYTGSMSKIMEEIKADLAQNPDEKLDNLYKELENLNQKPILSSSDIKARLAQNKSTTTPEAEQETPDSPSPLSTKPTP